MSIGDVFGKIRMAFVYGLFIAMFVFVTANLFFKDQLNQLTGYFSGNGEITDVSSLRDLTIAEPSPMLSFEPTVFESFTRQRLNNIYEPLVQHDHSLNIQPCLALSWGMTSDTKWDVILRPNVLFHDGSVLDSEDVLQSILRAKKLKSSELKDLLSTIKEVRVVDDLNLEIETSKPDPLFLQRLATIYILPSEVLKKFEKSAVEEPVGTAPYKVTEATNDGVLKLERFEEYWGKKPNFGNVQIVTISNTEGRAKAVADGTIDILDYVPYDFVKELPASLKVYAVPSLEVQFLVFNDRRELFKDEMMRQAVSLMLDREGFASFLGEYVVPSYQFVSTGIFGYNSGIESYTYDPEKVKEALDKLSGSGEVDTDDGEVSADGADITSKEIVIYLPKGLEILGDYLGQQFSSLGLQANISYFEGQDYIDALLNGGCDMYFMGFKSELGDSSDFLTSVVHTRSNDYGQYNFVGYSNSIVDKYIEDQATELDTSKRLSLLKDAMKVVVSDEMFGIPLFQYETVFAVKSDLFFEPRVDGYIYINELGT